LQQSIEPEFRQLDMESMERCIFVTTADYGVTAVIDWNRQSKVSREYAGCHDGNAAHRESVLAGCPAGRFRTTPVLPPHENEGT